jgi:hypothetical protein
MKKRWWATGIVQNEHKDVYHYSVEIPKFMSGDAIQKLIMAHIAHVYSTCYDKTTKGITLELVFLTYDYYTPMQWRATSPPIIIKNKGKTMLWGDGEGIFKSNFATHTKKKKRWKR